MLRTLNVATEFRDGQLYLHISNGASEDTVGPINPVDESAYVAVLEEPDLEAGVRPPSRSLRRRAALTEKRLAEDVGGKVQKNSGALPWAKGDVRKKGSLRLEAKTATTKGYRVMRTDLDKIRGECANGEKPGFLIEFINRLTHKLEDRWILIPYEDWREAHVD